MSFLQLFRFLPWFDYTIRKPILENGFLFKSDQYVSCFHQPILFLHAEDDKTVPLELGHKVFIVLLFIVYIKFYIQYLELFFSYSQLLNITEINHGDQYNFIDMMLPKILGIDI